VSMAPSGAGRRLARPFEVPSTPTLVDLHHTYVVRGSPDSVVAWISTRAPFGSALQSEGTTSAGGRYVAFRWPSSGTVVSNQMLLASAVGLSGNRTALRLDAQAVWLPEKPAGDMLPIRAPVVVMTRTSPGSTVVQTVVLRDPRVISNVVQQLNSLQVAPPGARRCPAATGPTVKLQFERAAGSVPFATVVAVGTGCRDVRVLQFGRWTAPALIGNDFVFFAGRAAGIGPRPWRPQPAIATSSLSRSHGVM